MARSHYLVDAVRVEGDVILDLRHRIEWGLIGPHCIEGTIPASRNAVVGRVALVGAVRGVFAARERGHIDVPTGDILNGRVGSLAKRQRIARARVKNAIAGKVLNFLQLVERKTS